MSSEEKFEEFLISRNDTIDNAAYELANALVTSSADEGNIKEHGKNLADALSFNSSSDVTEACIQRIIDMARDVLKNNPPRVDTDARIEWDMYYIGDIADGAESIMLETGIPTCHPYYSGEEEIPCCAYCGDENDICPNFADCNLREE